MEADLTGRVFRETLAAWESEANIVVNVGGTRSGKTYSVLQLLALIANRSAEPLLISVVTQTFPQLRQGAMRDFERVLAELPIPFSENRSTHTWEIGRSKIEFFSADQYEKVLGAQRDILFINEANRLGYEVVRQLMVRTGGKKFFDYNPVSAFWMNEHILTRNDVAQIHSTYLDNAHLSHEQIAEIESHRRDENWWRVYGLGLEGRLEGLVYPDWDIVEAMPPECKVRYGLDFGYNDPMALVKVGLLGDDLYVQCLVYKRGLIIDDLEPLMEAAGLERRRERILYDVAGKEQGKTLERRGWYAIECKKGRGSIIAGITQVKRFRLHLIRQGCEPLQNELLNYTWEKDRNDKNLDTPIDDFNHALDAIRYALADLTGTSGGYSLGWA